MDIINDGKNYLDGRVEEITDNIRILEQLKSPSEDWIVHRLSSIMSVKEVECVTEAKDPNGYLNKDGGYYSCVYFTTTLFDPSGVPGKDVIEKGTDAGGAIEVYHTLEDAEARCKYLSEFDDTLLYSGSYVLVGTMVIRTSYLLDNSEQTKLTDEIIKEFTKLV